MCACVRMCVCVCAHVCAPSNVRLCTRVLACVPSGLKVKNINGVECWLTRTTEE